MNDPIIVTLVIDEFPLDRPIRGNTVSFWKPPNPVIRFLEPIIKVQIEVPPKAKFVVNFDQFIDAELYAKEKPKPIFTPKGLQYIINQIEEAFEEPDQTIRPDIEFDDSEFEDF